MSVVIAICGKIAAGKSYYAEALRKEHNAVILSCDELVLELFGSDLGQQHDEITGRVRQFLFRKSVELVRCGCSVILEWGFWRASDRAAATDFYRSHGIDCRWHYIDISDDDWRANIEERNRRVLAGDSTAYFVDDGLLKKLGSLFEVPEREEIDVWHSFRRAQPHQSI